MDLKSKIELITQGTLEVITEGELEEKLKKERPIAYIGYEPSGKVHLGHTITVMKMIDLQKAGFKIKILLADYHAFLNGKGSLDEIKEVAEYNKKCFLALGLSSETEFILGSSFQTKEEYTTQVYQLALLTTLVRAKRSMAQITRDADDHKVAEVIYPLMQVIDMVFLETDLAWNREKYICWPGKTCPVLEKPLLYVCTHHYSMELMDLRKCLLVKAISLPLMIPQKI
jgi:tyrosyl-tRNA synthetase